MEEIMELIKLPFAILEATTTKDAAMGYAFLMILFTIGIIVVISFVLDFISNISKTIFKFFNDGFNSFMGIFKKAPKVAPIPDIENIVDQAIQNSYSDMSRNFKKMSDNLIGIDKKLKKIADKENLNDLM